jgi:hypothetical protein
MNMSQANCISCRKPKAALNCQVCDETVCKGCVQFLDADRFSFLKTVPEELSHTYYCSFCFDSKVAPALESYLLTLEQARNIFVFFNTRRNRIPLLSKSKISVQVEECSDRDETILRLAFAAAEQSYNAIIEVDVKSETVRNGTYRTSRWTGTAIPAQVDPEKVDF